MFCNFRRVGPLNNKIKENKSQLINITYLYIIYINIIYGYEHK